MARIASHIHSGNARKAGATDAEDGRGRDGRRPALRAGAAVTHATHALPNQTNARLDSLLQNVGVRCVDGTRAYRISCDIGMYCRPGALTGHLFQRNSNNKTLAMLENADLPARTATRRFRPNRARRDDLFV